MIKYTSHFRALAMALLTIGSFAGRANGNAFTIDFNDGTAAGSDIGSFYDSTGVTFSNGEWALLGGFTPHPDSTGFMLVGDGGNFQPKVGTPIVFSFSDPMAVVSIIANSVNANGARIDLYDATVGGNLVGFDQVVGPTGSLNSNFLMTATGTGIRRAELYQPFSVESEGVLFDNLYFSTVPEPASALFLGLAALGLAVRRRKSH